MAWIIEHWTKSWQNLCAQHADKGAFTGEVSGVLSFKDAQVNYVLVGHSERRQYFNGR